MVAISESSSSRQCVAAAWLAGGEVARGDPLYRRWRELAETAPAASVYQHPDFVLGPSEDGEGGPVLFARPAGRGGEPDRLACLAALVAKDWKVQPVPALPWGFRLRGLQLAGSRLLGDDGKESAEAFVGELIGRLNSAGARTDFVLFENLEVHSPLWDALAAGRRDAAILRPSEPQPHWWIEVPERADDYWKQLSKETRRDLRKNAKRLEHTLVRYAAPEQVPELLRKAHQVSRASWQSRRLGLRVRNDQEETRFWEAVAAVGGLRSYVLEQGGRPLAFQLAVQWNGCLLLEETGYDPAYRGSSPGSVLVYRVLEDVLAQDTPRLIDFGFGDGGHKASLCNRKTMSGPVLLVRRGWRPMAAMRLWQARQSVSRRARATLKSLRVLPVLRRLYRR